MSSMKDVQREAAALSACFIDNHAGHLHPILQRKDSHYDQRLQQYVAGNQDPLTTLSIQSAENDLEERARLCEKAMKAFLEKRRAQNASKQPPTAAIRATWAEVLTEVQIAREKWNNKASGKRGIFRKTVRSTSNVAKTANPLLEPLPNSDYGSIACGGLKLLFQAIISGDDARNLITECLEVLPDRIEAANENLHIYIPWTDLRQDQRLRKVAISLTLAILGLIEVVITYFEKSGLRKSLSAFLKQADYPAPITASIAQVNKESDALLRLADEYQRRVNMQTLQKAIHLEEACGKLQLTNDQQSAMLQGLQGQLGNLEVTFKNSLVNFFTNGLTNSDWMRDFLLLPRMPTRPSTPIPPTLVDHLSVQHYLGVKPDSIESGIKSALVASPEHLLKVSILVQQLSREPRWSQWMRSNQSDFLVLDRNSEVTNPELSHFAAVLVSSLGGYAPAIAVHFFCPIEDASNGPGSFFLLRSLIYQLLLFPNGLAITAQEVSELPRNPDQLRGLFLRLLSSFRGKTVFFVIDGLAWHAAEDEDEAILVVRILNEASRVPFDNVRVKVLLTAPVPLEVAEYFPEDSQIMLEDGAGEYSEFGLDYLKAMLGCEPSEMY